MVKHFRYLGTNLKNQNPIHEEIKCILKLENACCHAVQNLLSSSLLLINMKIKIHRTKFLLLFFMGGKPGRSH